MLKEAIKKDMKRKKISFEQVAENLNMTRAYLYYLQNLERNGLRETITAMAEYFKLDPELLRTQYGHTSSEWGEYLKTNPKRALREMSKILKGNQRVD